MALMEDGKLCRKCDTVKSLDGFHKCSRNKTGVQSKCKVCSSKIGRTRYAQNKDRVLLANRSWSNRNKEKHDLARRLWKSNNRGLVNYHTAIRRARKKKATPAWANLSRIKYIYDHCNWLNTTFNLNLHVDHIIPLAGANICGLHIHTNLQVIPAEVNLKKQNKLLQEYM